MMKSKVSITIQSRDKHSEATTHLFPCSDGRVCFHVVRRAHSYGRRHVESRQRDLLKLLQELQNTEILYEFTI